MLTIAERAYQYVGQANGEQVYHRLCKEFPKASINDLIEALEDAEMLYKLDASDAKTAAMRDHCQVLVRRCVATQAVVREAGHAAANKPKRLAS